MGWLIETPNINKLAANGLTYTNWHTTALCSPTRSSLLTGRNHTTNGMACIAEATAGTRASNGHIPFECATIAEVLGERGWNTYMLGKWHLVAADEMNMASTKRNWPVGRGSSATTASSAARRTSGIPTSSTTTTLSSSPLRIAASGPRMVLPPDDDLTDKAIEFIKDAKMVAPDKPFFMYFCPGADHAPHHAPKEWIEKYKGKFDMGYEKYRESSSSVRRSWASSRTTPSCLPINPYAGEKSVDGKPWPPWTWSGRGTPCQTTRRSLFTRMAEVYAGFLSHADHEIGRLLDYLEESGELDNTIIVLVSDNGASGEGGPNGSVNENKFFNGIPDEIEDNMKYLDELGPGDL